MSQWLASAVWPLAHSSLAPSGQPQQELGALGSGRVPMFCLPELSPSRDCQAFGELFGSVSRLLVWCPGSIRQPGRMRVSKLCVIGLTAAVLGCMFFVALSWFYRQCSWEQGGCAAVKPRKPTVGCGGPAGLQFTNTQHSRVTWSTRNVSVFIKDYLFMFHQYCESISLGTLSSIEYY